MIFDTVLYNKTISGFLFVQIYRIINIKVIKKNYYATDTHFFPPKCKNLYIYDENRFGFNRYN